MIVSYKLILSLLTGLVAILSTSLRGSRYCGLPFEFRYERIRDPLKSLSKCCSCYDYSLSVGTDDGNTCNVCRQTSPCYIKSMYSVPLFPSETRIINVLVDCKCSLSARDPLKVTYWRILEDGTEKLKPIKPRAYRERHKHELARQQTAPNLLNTLFISSPTLCSQTLHCWPGRHTRQHGRITPRRR